MDNFYNFAMDNFYKNWEKLIDLYSNFNSEDRIILNNCCCFCVSPNPAQRSQFIFHVLIIMNAFVCEALPTKNNLQYEVRHFYWYADQTITRESNKFYKKRDELIKYAENKMKEAIATDSPPPFTNKEWWFECENIFPGTKTPIYKRSIKIFGETITLLPNGKCLHNKIPRKNLGDNVQKIDIIPMPSARSCAELCHRFYKTLINPIIRREMLFQLAQDPNITQYKNVITPAHMGWIEELDLFEYIGLKSLNSEISTTGGLKEAKNNIAHELYEDLFKIVPSRISIPLFAYSLFSIIKFFISSYPSRISQQQSFKSVVKEQRKMIFMSLSGENALPIAKAFCGVFTKNTPSERVHDGIVIINKPPENFIDFVNEDMIRDASVLCINPSYEKNPYEIAVRTDVAFSDEDNQKIQIIVQNIIYEFIEYLSDKHIEITCKQASICFRFIYNKFIDCYKKNASLLYEHSDDTSINLKKFSERVRTTCCTWLSVAILMYYAEYTHDTQLELAEGIANYEIKKRTSQKRFSIFKKEANQKKTYMQTSI